MRRGLEDVLPDDHFLRAVDDAQVGGVDVGDFARPVDDADAVLHCLQEHLQPLLHERIFLQERIDAAYFARARELEPALQEAHHFADGLTSVVSLGRDEDRVAACDFERNEAQDVLDLHGIALRAAQAEPAGVALPKLLRTPHDHRGDPCMDAARLADHGLFFVPHATSPFSRMLTLYYMDGENEIQEIE